MAQTQKKTKQPQDPYAARGRTLASLVQRLRGWIGTDPARAPELVDALNELVEHRLRGHAWGAAGSDAQEAVKRSADLLLADGPIGPYTTAPEAGRCGTALVQLAALQVGLGLAEPAGRTLGSWDGLREQLATVELEPPLRPETVVRALVGAGRVALAADDVATANACADAALARLAASGLREDEATGYLALDVDRLAADARWAAGRPEESLALLQAAQRGHETAAAGRLAEPGRYPPALVERLAEPLFVLHRDLADRLAAGGELDLALVTRRGLVALLHGLAPRGGDLVRDQLVAALTDLAQDLLAEGRAEEARAEAEQAWSLAGERSVPGVARLLAAEALCRAQPADEQAVAMLRRVLAAEGAAEPAARAVALRTLAEAARATGDDGTATALEQEAAALVPGPAARARDRARGVLSRPEAPVTWSALDPVRGYAGADEGAPAVGVDVAGASARREQERAEAVRREAERAEQARVDAERRETEAARAAAAAAEQERARQAAEAAEQARADERRRAEEEAEQAERKRRREERLREHQEEVDRREHEIREARRLDLEARLHALTAVAVPTAAEERERERLLAERADLDAADAPVAPEPEPADRALSLSKGEAPTPEPVAEPADRALSLSKGEALTPEPEPADRALSLSKGEAPTPEPAAEPQPTPAPDELTQALQGLTEARTSGGRREVRAALERLVEALRPRAATDPAYVLTLRSALEELASARLRSGDLFGSRAANREARGLGRAGP